MTNFLGFPFISEGCFLYRILDSFYIFSALEKYCSIASWPPWVWWQIWCHSNCFFLYRDSVAFLWLLSRFFFLSFSAFWWRCIWTQQIYVHYVWALLSFLNQQVYILCQTWDFSFIMYSKNFQHLLLLSHRSLRFYLFIVYSIPHPPTHSPVVQAG